MGMVRKSGCFIAEVFLVWKLTHGNMLRGFMGRCGEMFQFANVAGGKWKASADRRIRQPSRSPSSAEVWDIAFATWGVSPIPWSESLWLWIVDLWIYLSCLSEQWGPSGSKKKSEKWGFEAPDVMVFPQSSLAFPSEYPLFAPDTYEKVNRENSRLNYTFVCGYPHYRY